VSSSPCNSICYAWGFSGRQSQMERGMRGWSRQPIAVHRSSCSGSSWPSTPKPTCQCNLNSSQVPSMWPYLQIRLWTSKPYACSQQTFLILRCIVVVDIDGQLQASKLQRTDNNVLRTLIRGMCTNGKIWNAGTGSQIQTDWCEGGIVYY